MPNFTISDALNIIYPLIWVLCGAHQKPYDVLDGVKSQFWSFWEDLGPAYLDPHCRTKSEPITWASKPKQNFTGEPLLCREETTQTISMKVT